MANGNAGDKPFFVWWDGNYGTRRWKGPFQPVIKLVLHFLVGLLGLFRIGGMPVDWCGIELLSHDFPS